MPLEDKFIDRLKALQDEHDDLARQLADPEIVSDLSDLRRVSKRYNDLSQTVSLFEAYQTDVEQYEEAREMLADPSMRELAQGEMAHLAPLIEDLADRLRTLLLPRDPRDDKNVIIEVRAGAGGEEAALFASELLRMYSRYAERKNWKTELLSLNETDLGGYREAAMAISAKGAFSRLKYESGVHRVQRVPATESGGRIHTSTATVAVLPEAEEVELEIRPEDLQIDTYRSSSAGGQNVQKNETAVRIIHLPTGTVVTCQDERSQYQNKEKAMRFLRSQILERRIAEQEAEMAQDRRTQVGTGERNEKGRTYNFPQDRITDHRIHLTVHSIPRVMDGELDAIIDAHIAADQNNKLENG
ncbi:MAG TPA: peptide chain release factor 1 [Armatimonadota bacterium]|nr:peptide chain release factor 1 [Armatimonadota bacterium]